MNYRHYQHYRNPIVSKMLIVQIFRSVDFAPFGLFVKQKVQKAQKTDFCNPRSMNFQHFPHFPNLIVLKMWKVQIPHNVGNVINPNRYGFCGFCSG